MSEILSIVLTGVISILGTTGIGSIFFIRQNRRLKDAEVKAADIENLKAAVEAAASSNEEWQKLYNQALDEKAELKEENKALNEKLDKYQESKEDAWQKYSDCKILCEKKERKIADLEWYRCEINGCPYRKPPRKFGDLDFPGDGINPVENPDPTVA